MKVTLGGREIEATPMTVQGERLVTTTMLCDDGTALKVTLVITEVLRLEGEKDMLGRQAYFIQQMTSVVTT